jgi:hypothetical protein
MFSGNLIGTILFFIRQPRYRALVECWWRYRSQHRCGRHLPGIDRIQGEYSLTDLSLPNSRAGWKARMSCALQFTERTLWNSERVETIEDRLWEIREGPRPQGVQRLPCL